MPLYGDQFSAFPYNQRSVWDNDHRIFGPLKLVTAPTDLAVSVPEAQQQCRITTDRDNDSLEMYIRAATRYVEKNIPGGRQIMTATWDLALRDFWYAPLKLPKPPLQSATLSYYDSNDALQTVNTSLYEVRAYESQPGEIELKPFKVWPARGFGWSPFSSGRTWPVTVRFVAGYTSSDDVPYTTKLAILMLVQHWYNHRGPFDDDGASVSTELAFAVTNLLDTEGYGAYS